MVDIWKSDFYRFKKNWLFYLFALITTIIALALTTLHNKDIRLGISIFGNVTGFTEIVDIIRIGNKYYSGLGVFIAIVISDFIGQEYEFETWQNKWIVKKSRVNIYLSKAIISSMASAAIFLLFQTIVLLFSGMIFKMLTISYFDMILSGVFIYATLGAVFCMFSMILKNGMVFCIFYALLAESMVSLIIVVSKFSSVTEKVALWLVQHSVYGMSATLASLGVADITFGTTVSIIINSIVIIFISALAGSFLFKKYDL